MTGQSTKPGIGVLGAGGRVGQLLLREVLESGQCRLASALVRPGSPLVGRDAGALVGLGDCGVAVTDQVAAVVSAADVVIDFSVPAAAAGNAATAAGAGVPLLVGTTGLSAEQVAAVEAAAARIPVLIAANTSLGVNLLLGLVRQVARVLDDGFDIEIVEMHHRHKVDAPSGTALALGRAAAAGRGIDAQAGAVRARDGHTGARPRGVIGYAALRGGDVVGDHTVVFAGAGERLELTHRAGSRRIYAAGALKAGLWLAAGRAPGLYGMSDVLGL
ncbi:MAG: 4-hydroxy-tetrahydrodipicolinate reductase [Thalassobaculales bacterium]